MRYLLIGLLFIVGCDSDKTCDFETNQCYTKAQWDEISRANWENVKCLQKQFDKHISLEKAYKICGLTEGTRVDFK